MAKPAGRLTSAQNEILELVWQTQGAGATVTQIWEAIAARRSVTRTTVLNLVDRLEKRGWLRRKKVDGTFRYLATVDSATAGRMMAEEFVSEFFGGSASRLVTSLLGGKRLTPEEARRLRELLEMAAQESD